MSCSWPIHDLFMTFSQFFHNLFFICSGLIIWELLFTTCSYFLSHLIHDLFLTCLPIAPILFLKTCSWLVQNFFTFLFTTCSLPVKDLFRVFFLQFFHNLFRISSFGHYFFMTSSLFVHDLFKSCSQLVPNLFTNCSQLFQKKFHNLFTPCSLLVQDIWELYFFMTC